MGAAVGRALNFSILTILYIPTTVSLNFSR